MKINDSLPAIVLIDKIDSLKQIDDEFGIVKKSYELLAKNRRKYSVIIPSVNIIEESKKFEISKVTGWLPLNDIFNYSAIVFNNITMAVATDEDNGRVLINAFAGAPIAVNLCVSMHIDMKNPSKATHPTSNSPEMVHEVLQTVLWVLEYAKNNPMEILRSRSKSALDGKPIKNLSKTDLFLLK